MDRNFDAMLTVYTEQHNDWEAELLGITIAAEDTVEKSTGFMLAALN